MVPNGTETSPLHVLIVGSGIGGLAAAIALRKQGHNVEIFEQSKLAQETGAAINITPNSNGLVRDILGLDLAKIGAVDCLGFLNHDPNGAVMQEADFSDANFKHPYHMVHRAHLHTALKKLAISEHGEGRPVRLHVSSRVKVADAEEATITLQDGSVIQGDVVVGADGVHSRVRSSIPGGDLVPFDCGKSAFRFLVPFEKLASDPAVPREALRPGILVMWTGENRRLVMYPCVKGTVMNVVAIHPSEESADGISGAGWQGSGSKAKMLEIYKDFSPSVRAILENVEEEDLKLWNLLDMAKMPAFAHERLAVIGDAAHPFLPHQGQGGGQAIEDAVSLATMLPLGTPRSAIPERLKLYEECRYERAHKVQEFSRLIGKDASELAAQGKVLNLTEFSAYNFNHDEYEHTMGVLQGHLAAGKP